MSIASIAGTIASPVQSSSDTASLEQQLGTLEEALQTVKQGKADEKTKAQRIKEIEAQSAKGGVSSQEPSAGSATVSVGSPQSSTPQGLFDPMA